MDPATNATGSHRHNLPVEPSDSNSINTLSLVEDAVSESPQDEAHAAYWTPFWLRKPTLLALIALFTALAASLIVLLVVEQARNGIRPILSSNHYAWTYGPTAILVVVLSLWRQVDYYCKLMQPWQEMHKGPQDADNSLMLDYVSPIMFTSLVKAIRRRHIPVAASITGFIIMKLIILFSTGLLVLTSMTVTGAQSVNLTTGFATNKFWNTVPSDNYVVLASNQEISTYSNISAGPVHAYLKALETPVDNYNFSLSNMVFQSLEPESTTELFGVTAEVDAFVPNISCEIAQPVLLNTRTGDWSARLDSATCSVGAEHQTALELKAAYTFCDKSCPDSVVQYNFWRANFSEVDNSSLSTRIDANTPYDFRFALLVSNFTFETILEDNRTHFKGIPHETAAVICKMDYSMTRATIYQDLKNGAIQANHLAAAGHLNNLTGIMLGEIMHDALWASQDLALNGENLRMSPEITTPLYYMLLRTLAGEQSMKRFLAAETLQSSASQVWAGIASQFIRQSCITTANTNSTATGVFVESRLQVGLVSLWAMVVGFVLLILLTICIIFTTRNDVVLRDPGYLAMSGLTMITSPTMAKLLDGFGDLRTSQLSENLSGLKFQTQIDHSFQIKAIMQTQEDSKRHTKRKTTGWIPLAAQYPMVGLTLIVPIAAMVALEVLYQISQRKNGVCDVYDKERTATYLSRYISSSIVLLIATLSNSLDFAVASFAPYSLLRSGAVPASRSLSFNILGKLAPMALVDSMKAKHLSSVFSNSAGIIGSVLTIIASGLWVIDRAVLVDYPVTASLTDTWDVSWHNSSNSGDGGAITSFDGFQHGSTVLPSASWHDIVFPHIADMGMPSGIETRGDATTQNVTIQHEGLRPRLDCEIVADEYLSVEYGHINNYGVERILAVNATPPIPARCQRAERAGRVAYYYFGSTHAPNSAEEIDYMGDFSNVEAQVNNSAGCPSIGIIFTVNHKNKSSYEDVSAVLCSQRIEQVKLNVSYLGLDMTQPSINTNIDPVIIPQPVKYLTNGTEGIDSFPYHVQNYFDNLTRFNIQDGEVGVVQPLDEFFNHLVYGPNGTSQADLAGKQNRARFTEAVENLYARYMTFVIDQRFRQPIASTAANGSLVHGTAYRTTSRLKVNYASKLTLQIMLAAMTVLGASAFWLTDLRGTLPRKPTTIASALALFAGSDLCEEKKPLIPQGALWMRGKELDKVFDGWLFSLGWWTKTQRSTSTRSNENDETSKDALLKVREEGGRRFGIDVGVADQLGFR